MSGGTTQLPHGVSTRGERAYRRGQAKVVGIFATALVLLMGVGAVVRSELRDIMKEELAGNMRALRDTVGAGVTVWLDAQECAAAAIGSAPRLGSLARATLSGEAADGELRAALSGLVEGQLFHGVALIDLDGRIVEAHDIGLDSGMEELPREVRDAHAGALAGRALASRPFRGVDGSARMVVAAPVVVDGETFGVIVLGLDPAEFSATLHAARAGDSGETYAVGPEGHLISDSRFLTELREIRLIDSGDETAILELDVRDPGGDLTAGYTTGTLRHDQELTAAARRALSGEDGVDVEGYRDYRGVSVIGAWDWLPRHEFAVITEVDVAEAYRPLVVLERIFMALLSLILAAAIVALAVGMLLTRQRRRAARAEKRAAKLGQYTLEAKLGEGGMGTVYRARHALLRRPTAIKLLHSTHGSDLAHDRFEREVRRTAELTHPNTIAIYDYGHTADGVFYYAMEYLEGVDLEVLIDRFGPISDGRAIHIIRQAAGALSEAHDAGMVHRDIKPANIVLCRRGGIPDTVKVLDFGLVKSSDEEDKTLTAENAVIGTPAYLPPEMVESADKATPQTDLYALGAVAYFLVTGELVFDGETAMSMLMAHISKKPVPPSERAGRTIDPILEAEILACLEKDPAERPKSAAALIAALDASEAANAWARTDAEAWWTKNAEALKILSREDRETIGSGDVLAHIAVTR